MAVARQGTARWPWLEVAPWSLCLALGLASIAVYYLLPVPLQTHWFNVVVLAAGVAMVAGVRRHRPARPLPWYLLIAGSGATILGDGLWTVYTEVLHAEPFPSLADGFYLAAYPFLAAGLLLLIRGRSPQGDWTSLLDATIIATGFGLLVWVFVYVPYVRDPSLSLLERVFTIAYPAGDLLLLALAARLAITGGRGTASFRWLLAAMLALVYADVLFSLLALTGDYTSAYPADAGYLGVKVLLAVAALHPSMGSTAEPVEGSPARLGRVRLAALAGASLMAPAALVVQRAVGERVDAVVVAVAAAVLFLLVVARMAGLIWQVEHAQAERGRLLDRTVRAAEQERGRIAAELHDGAIQQLATLCYDLERARLKLDAGRVDAGVLALREAQDKLVREVGELRRLMAALRPPVLDEVGLEAALRDHVASFGRQTGIACEVEVRLPERLDEGLETVLYRVTQEALTNVEKHAWAGRLRVALRGGRDGVRLDVRDDGVGSDPGLVASSLAGQEHFGLIGMRERVEMAGGTWSVDTRPGAGVAIRAAFARKPS